MQELIGQTLDRYQIVASLSEERWGNIFKAYDPKLDRTVILRVLDSQWEQDSGIGDFVLQSARTIIRWRQAGIARILDLGRAAALSYVVQEFIPGANLQQLLPRLRGANQWISLSEAVQLVIEVCQALEYAHQRGFIHGDLTPAHILFKGEPANDLPYQPVLVGLGMVRPGHPAAMSAAPAPASPYQAPELTRGEKLEASSDIYAIGAILYELATGQAPFPGVLRSPRTLRNDLPTYLDQVIVQALAINPADRYSNPGSLAAALSHSLPEVTLLQSVPQGFGQPASLLPAYQLSLAEPLFALLSAQTPPAPPPAPTQPTATSPIDISQDQIHILEPNQSVNSVFMKPGGLTIGRGSDNDVILDRPGISRHHARIDFDGQNYQVTDLKSMNGTFLDETSLTPGIPQTWTTDDNLRVGEVWLRLERAGQSQTTRAWVAPPQSPKQPPAAPAGLQTVASGRGLPQTDVVFVTPTGDTIDTAQVKVSSLGWVGVYVETPNLAVSPGSGATVTLILFNRGPKPDVFELSYQGIPLDWLSSPPRPVGIPADGQREVQVTIRPPRTSAGKAGRHVLTIHVASQSASDQFTEVRVTLTVTAFSQFYSEMQPRQLTSGQVGQVLIHNRGNLPETFTVLWEDRLNQLSFEPPQVKITVQPGKSAAVEFRPSMLRPRWFGSEITHQFKAHVSAQTGQLQSHNGEYFSHGLIPAWAPVLLFSLCAVLSCMLFLIFNQLLAPRRATQSTAQAALTGQVQTTQQLATANALTATALIGANQSTVQAVTATAAWANADDDQDGLSNSQEIANGTLPEQPDSDNDGLKDGEEVNAWKTKPLNPDTDSDQLKDGTEVARGTDPLLWDTDGDGLDDFNDPDPLRAPTRTPVIILTFTPSPPPLTPTPIIQYADLNISITNGRATSTPGTNTNYTITVINRGPATTNNVQVTSSLPTGLINATWTCTAPIGSRCQTPNGIGNINAFVDLSAGGSATLSINGQINPDATGTLNVTANTSIPFGMIETNPFDNQSTDSDTLVPSASLSLSKSDNRTQVEAGDSTTYTIIVANNGPSSVNSITVNDVFPGALENISWQCKASPGSSCAAGGVQAGNINTQVNLRPGGNATFTANATVKASATGTINNSVSIASPVDPATNNKTANDTTDITGLQADLSIHISAPPTVTVSSPLTYTLDVSNDGPAPATDLILENHLPTGAMFITYTIETLAGTPTCLNAPGLISCQLGDLPPGGSARVTIVAIAPAIPGAALDQAEIKANEVDPDPSDNTVNITVDVY